MAKVITVSRNFPSYHARKGDPTYFVEKILNALEIDYKDESYMQNLLLWNTKNLMIGKLSYNDLCEFWGSLKDTPDNKLHTIRAGDRWKQGEKASLRVWSATPYNSPQIIFAPEVELKMVEPIIVSSEHYVYLRGGQFEWSPLSPNLKNLANNDGLTAIEMIQWFNKIPFSGQILCWDQKVEY